MRGRVKPFTRCSLSLIALTFVAGIFTEKRIDYFDSIIVKDDIEYKSFARSKRQSSNLSPVLWSSERFKLASTYIQVVQDIVIYHKFEHVHFVFFENSTEGSCGFLITMFLASLKGSPVRPDCYGILEPNVPLLTLLPSLSSSYDNYKPAYLLVQNDKIKDLVQVELQKFVPKTHYKFTLLWPTSEDTIAIQDVFGLSKSNPLFQTVGNWSVKDGLQVDPDLALGPTDFNGRLLTVTTVAGPPVVFVKKLRSGVSSSGYLPDMLEILSQSLNFTYQVVTPPDGQFGNINPNGSWSGMVGMLQRKEADIAMMSFSLTASRKTVMDFSPPVEYSSVRLLIRRDWQNAELKWSAYARPFEKDVWIAIPITIVIGVAAIAVFRYFRVVDITPVNSVWLLSSCFILQGQEEHSNTAITPFRFVMGTFWVLSVVVFACYTARLTAYLAATEEVLPVKDLMQAVKNRNWKVGLVTGSAFIDRIKESRVDVLRRLYQRISEDPSSLVGSFQEGMDRVFLSRYLFFTSELIPSFLIRSNCSYTWLPDKYYSGFGYMGYQTNLPFSPVLSHRLMILRQSGQMRRLFQKWWGTASVCYTNSGDAFLPMTLFETGTAFFILLFGASFSITFIVGEFLFRRRRRTALSSGSGRMSKTSSIVSDMFRVNNAFIEKPYLDNFD